MHGVIIWNQNVGFNMILKKKNFDNDIPPHFKFLLSNERLDFCDFFL